MRARGGGRIDGSERERLKTSNLPVPATASNYVDEQKLKELYLTGNPFPAPR